MPGDRPARERQLPPRRSVWYPLGTGQGQAAPRYRDALEVAIQTESATESSGVSVTFNAANVGHPVPTGLIGRHLQAEDAQGHTAPVVNGPCIPEFAGKSVAGQPGELYARVLI
jgi:hypothetical protein